MNGANSSGEKWLEVTRQQLYDHWVKTTRHAPDAINGTWACEIAYGCRTCNEHLSLPCSLLAEANEIGLFLSTSCFASRPSSFLRFYLILLSEFVNQLREIADVLGLSIGKPPKEVVVWANRWAKHRLHILIQHHPVMIFADKHGTEWPEIEKKLPGSKCENRCGKQQTSMLIDTNWLCSEAAAKPDLLLANSDAKAVIVVPPMQMFLDCTCAYFRKFIDVALLSPDAVRQFQSEHASVRC